MSESNYRTAGGTDVDRAVKAFRSGEPVLVHDATDREDETDIVYPAAAVGPEDVTRLRNDAGGLVCVALAADVADSFDLPFLADALDHPSVESGNLAYGDRSSFSLPVNHRDTVTGIPDGERALTISALGAAAAEPDRTEFAASFRAPGHVPLLRAADGLLSERRGHTELSIRLALEADRAPATVVCEMLDDDTGEALTREAAAAYAWDHGLVQVEGTEIVNSLR
ncbi:3,4-dihydroxy-2-butanone-4-phosphate synthase [Halorarum halobium]|uniref:3,4-dihydroxy-2-butanone-4-phosphate synthase n=1 Tax=Halorarum halobium TaxID=3075121 RepID=UPI0028AEEFEB|nr:3,4-dihydroxy-2-butanone-4-phosphate synthase [Halobaculum sp. XH14]